MMNDEENQPSPNTHIPMGWRNNRMSNDDNTNAAVPGVSASITLPNNLGFIQSTTVLEYDDVVYEGDTSKSTASSTNENDVLGSVQTTTIIEYTATSATSSSNNNDSGNPMGMHALESWCLSLPPGGFAFAGAGDLLTDPESPSLVRGCQSLDLCELAAVMQNATPPTNPIVISGNPKVITGRYTLPLMPWLLSKIVCQYIRDNISNGNKIKRKDMVAFLNKVGMYEDKEGDLPKKPSTSFMCFINNTQCILSGTKVKDPCNGKDYTDQANIFTNAGWYKPVVKFMEGAINDMSAGSGRDKYLQLWVPTESQRVISLPFNFSGTLTVAHVLPTWGGDLHSGSSTDEEDLVANLILEGAQEGYLKNVKDDASISKLLGLLLHRDYYRITRSYGSAYCRHNAVGSVDEKDVREFLIRLLEAVNLMCGRSRYVDVNAWRLSDDAKKNRKSSVEIMAASRKSNSALKKATNLDAIQDAMPSLLGLLRLTTVDAEFDKDGVGEHFEEDAMRLFYRCFDAGAFPELLDGVPFSQLATTFFRIPGQRLRNIFQKNGKIADALQASFVHVPGKAEVMKRDLIDLGSAVRSCVQHRKTEAYDKSAELEKSRCKSISAAIQKKRTMSNSAPKSSSLSQQKKSKVASSSFVYEDVASDYDDDRPRTRSNGRSTAFKDTNNAGDGKMPALPCTKANEEGNHECDMGEEGNTEYSMAYPSWHQA